MNKLSVHLVTWNGAKYIPYLFQSLRNQIFKDWEILIIDNASADNTVEQIQKELINFNIPSRVIVNNQNSGFTGGHNQAYLQTSSEYFLMLNQDMYLLPDCLQKMVNFLDANADAAAVSPRLMRWNFSAIAGAGQSLFGGADNKSFTNQIDSLGLKVFKNRRVVEQFTKEEWPLTTNKQINPSAKILEVFGVSGAFPMFRRQAINQIAFSDKTFLDNNHESYKEDVDLAFRLRSHGLQSYVILNSIAYHDRTGAGPKEAGDRAAISNKLSQPVWVRYHSYKNQLMVLYKNEYWQNFILDLPWILWYELKKFLYFLIFDIKTLVGLKELYKRRKNLKIKRLEIKNKRIVGWREIRKWWSK